MLHFKKAFRFDALILRCAQNEKRKAIFVIAFSRILAIIYALA